jgi:hypothetical protein
MGSLTVRRNPIRRLHSLTIIQMAGTLITIFRWSLIRFSSILLILVWAFNPLGSQASFRGVSLVERVGMGTGEITYLSPDLIAGLQNRSIFGFTRDPTATLPLVRPLYISAVYDIIAKTQYVNQSSQAYQDIILSLGGRQAAGAQASMDPWGNVRIPHLEYLDTYQTTDPYEWHKTPWTKEVQNWSSLIGDPLQGLNRTFIGNTTFKITSSYQKFTVSRSTPQSHIYLKLTLVM